MTHGDHIDGDSIKFTLEAIGELCAELASQGCGPVEVASALASMLGIVTAAITCCPEHEAEAEDVVIEIFEDSLATHRARFAAFDRVGPAGLHRKEGHA